jgi:hypothetical protein
LTTIINGKEIKETLLEKQLESINRNNELLNENNVKLSEQNDKMLKYTKAIYILTGLMSFVAIIQLIMLFVK